MLTLDKKIKQKCNSAILILGPFRSGTTIVGKIISSMKNIEYIYEPPTLVTLIHLIKEISKKNWQLLYETYLYEEFLINALAGRNLNFNKNDESYILSTKDYKSIKRRFSKTWRKHEVEKILNSTQIFYKLSGAIFCTPEIQKYYPKTKAIIMLRKPNDVIHSIKRKGWYSNRSLKFSNQVWPNKMYEGYRIPYFVKEKDAQYFWKLDEINRIAYYYIQACARLDKVKNKILIKYEDLIVDPEKEVGRIAKKFNLSFGPKTKKLINSVKLRNIDRSKDLIELLDDKLREKILKFEDKIWRKIN